MKKKGKSKVKNKELETSIIDKFMEVIHGLGHNVDDLKKEIAKAGKAVSEKIGNILKDAKKATDKEAGKAVKPAKKGGKKKNEAKTSIKKAEAKVEKVVSEVSKVASGKASTISSRSVAKPVVPTINKPADAASTKKEEVKEASAETPVKRTRAPRRKKEEMEAAEKISVKEASAPVKRKRAPRKPKLITTSNENPSTETTGSAVL